jgi:vacuolar iron transporter family protein
MTRHVWEATLSTFLAKFITAATFAIPVLLFELRTSIMVSIFWGLMVLAPTFMLARQQGLPPWKAIGEHVLVAVGVVTISYYVGLWAKDLIE